MNASQNRSRALKTTPFSGKCVLYWMVRDKRVNDNWALIEAQNIAIRYKVSLVVCFQFYGSHKQANIRQYHFY